MARVGEDAGSMRKAASRLEEVATTLSDAGRLVTAADRPEMPAHVAARVDSELAAISRLLPRAAQQVGQAADTLNRSAPAVERAARMGGLFSMGGIGSDLHRAAGGRRRGHGGGGGALGGAVGSIIPGPGTAVGAAVGATAGRVVGTVVGGIVVDKVVGGIGKKLGIL